jgi:hypothetical protein
MSRNKSELRAAIVATRDLVPTASDFARILDNSVELAQQEAYNAHAI